MTSETRVTVCPRHGFVYTDKALGAITEVIKVLGEHGVTEIVMELVECDCMNLAEKIRKDKECEERLRTSSPTPCSA
ncbi:MAG: hypothetical protein NTW60_03935 [Candidatus Wolfebacteria bacterium]|nr:hypothetical protein [Candidatus Wolfebacteria bacterium]